MQQTKNNIFVRFLVLCAIFNWGLPIHSPNQSLLLSPLSQKSSNSKKDISSHTDFNDVYNSQFKEAKDNIQRHPFIDAAEGSFSHSLDTTNLYLNGRFMQKRFLLDWEIYKILVRERPVRFSNPLNVIGESDKTFSDASCDQILICWYGNILKTISTAFPIGGKIRHFLFLFTGKKIPDIQRLLFPLLKRKVCIATNKRNSSF